MRFVIPVEAQKNCHTHHPQLHTRAVCQKNQPLKTFFLDCPLLSSENENEYPFSTATNSKIIISLYEDHFGCVFLSFFLSFTTSLLRLFIPPFLFFLLEPKSVVVKARITKMQQKSSDPRFYSHTKQCNTNL